MNLSIGQYPPSLPSIGCPRTQYHLDVHRTKPNDPRCTL
jgi:hypothetical protein